MTVEALLRGKKHIRAKTETESKTQKQKERKKEHTLSETWEEEEKYMLYCC